MGFLRVHNEELISVPFLGLDALFEFMVSGVERRLVGMFVRRAHHLHKLVRLCSVDLRVEVERFSSYSLLGFGPGFR